eukprot:scaffold18209_cov88-Skeletonema_dohrnii-CCMP3373.AAC.3
MKRGDYASKKDAQISCARRSTAKHGVKIKLCSSEGCACSQISSEKSSHNEDCVSSTGQRSDNVAVIGAQTLLDNEKYAAGTGQERNNSNSEVPL